MNNPPVTVLMSVYNGARYLGEAIDSILGQTYRDFEFLIIDDGSTDDSIDIINSYDDPRIRLQQHPNRGLAESLRQGIIDARGDIIVRADQDDISYPNRIEKQVAYLNRTSAAAVGVVRTLLEIIDLNGTTVNVCTDEKVALTSAPRWWFLWRNIGSHASAAIRRGVLLEHNLNYRTEMDGVEDYDLWSRMMRYAEFGIIEKPLVKYRIHPNSMMQTTDSELQKSRFAIVVEEAFQAIDIPLSPSMAVEIAILSGQTLEDPEHYHFTSLIDVLHLISREASDYLEKSGECIPSHFRGIQYLQWACYLAPTSRSYGIRLLSEALRYNPRILLSRQMIRFIINLVVTRQ